MSVSRYRSDIPIRGGKVRRTATATMKIRRAVQRGDVRVRTIITKENERLDHLAARYYNDGSYWWIIAAASNIGWWLQVPPGTIITVPVDLSSVLGFV